MSQERPMLSPPATAATRSDNDDDDDGGGVYQHIDLAVLGPTNTMQIDALMNRVPNTFKDRRLEREFRAFFTETQVRRAMAMWAVWALLGLVAVLVRHASGRSAWADVGPVYGVLGLSAVGLVVLAKWRRRMEAVMDYDVFVCGLSAVCAVLACVDVMVVAERFEDDCDSRSDPAACLRSVSYDSGFRGGLYLAGYCVFTLGAVRKFLFFVAAELVAVVSYVATLRTLRHDRLDSPSLFLFVVVCLQLLWLHRANEMFERKQFLWYKGAVKLTRQHLRKIEREKGQKQRVVGYLFHEVRNPINDIVLATALALDAVAKVTFPSLANAAPPASQPGNNTPPEIQPGHDAAAHEDTPAELVSMLGVINQSAKAASRVLDDALDLQKLEAGKCCLRRGTRSERGSSLPT